MTLLRFALLRLLTGVALVFASVAGVFFSMRLIGNPIAIALEGRLTEQEIAARIEAAGLNRPLFTQFLEYLGEILQGSLGNSILESNSNAEKIAKYLPVSIEFGIIAMLFSVALALPLGYWFARKTGKKSVDVGRVATIIVYVLPIFLLAVVLKIVLAVWLPVFPVAGRLSVKSEIQLQKSGGDSGFVFLDVATTGSWQVIGDYLWHLTLPILSIGLITAAALARSYRASLLDQLNADWYLEAKKHFGSNWRTTWSQAFRPALAQLITATGTVSISVITGLVITEKVFEIRGLGFILTQAVVSRDYTLVQGIVVVIALLVIGINLATDLVAAILDPRFRRVIR
jgi:peptide/nickel transport system permease protein